MPRWFVLTATILLGIAPASLLILVVVLEIVVVGPINVPDDVVVVTDPSQVVVSALLAIAASVGYIALFFAAAGRMSRNVAVALLLGVAALVYEITAGLIPYWLGSPAIVGLAHAIGYFVGRHSRPASERARNAA